MGAWRRLQSGGLLPGRGADWDWLLRAAPKVPPTATLLLLYQWPYGMLKEPRPSADLYASLAQALQRGAASPAGEDDGAEPEAASQGAPDERGGSPPCSSQRRAFEAALTTFTPDEAVLALHTAQTAPGTKGTYVAALPLYQLACQAAGHSQWPLTVRSPEGLADYLRVSQAYQGPAVYFCAIVNEARSYGQAPIAPPNSGSALRHAAALKVVIILIY